MAGCQRDTAREWRYTPAVSRRWWVARFYHHNGFYYGSGPDISVVLLGFGFGLGGNWKSMASLFLFCWYFKYGSEKVTACLAAMLHDAV